MTESAETKKRYESLDALRGSGVLLLLGLVFLSGPIDYLTPGSFFEPLKHQLTESVWHGLRAADLLMPLFLFCCGAAVSAHREKLKDVAAAQVFRWAIGRALILFVLGLLASNVALFFGGQGFSLVGPLQQIAIAAFVVYCLVLFLPRGAAIIIVLIVLLNYGFLLSSYNVEPYSDTRLKPVFPYGFQNNLVAFVDSQYLPGQKSFGNWDRYGILPTGIGIVVAICGASFQQFVLASAPAKRGRRLLGAALLGSAFITAAWFASSVIPINAYLWTPTYLGLSTGILLVLICCLKFFLDRYPVFRFDLLRSLGRNSLPMFLLCSIGINFPLTAFNVTLAQNIVPNHQSIGLILIVVAEILSLVVFAYFLSLRNIYLTFNRGLEFVRWLPSPQPDPSMAQLIEQPASTGGSE